MDDKLKEQVELYILTNYDNYSRKSLIGELTKAGFTREDASQMYDQTIKRLLKPSQKMHHTNTSILPYIILTVIIVVIFGLIILV